MGQQMLGVQARIFDPALFEVGGRGLQNVEHRHKPRAPNAVIPSCADNASPARTEEPPITCPRLLRRSGPSPSARLRMTINKGARRVSITRSARCLSIVRPNRQLAALKSFPRARLP